MLPAAAMLAIAGALAWAELGKIAAADWLPYAVLAALVLATVFGSGVAGRVPPSLLMGAAALMALAAWQALSLTWSAVPSLARDEALLTLFYAAALLVPLLTLFTNLERTGALGLLVLTLGVLVVMTALKLRFGSAPLDAYDGGRLDFPVTYVNGDAAFFLVGFWPAVVLASQRSLPAVARALSFGAAAAFLATELMTQSKGGALGLGASAVAIFALCPGRLRSLVPTVLAAALVAAAFSPLTAPYRTTDAAGPIRHAATVLLLVMVAGLVVGAAYGALDARVAVSEENRRRIGIAVLALVAATALGSLVAFFATVHHPQRYFADKWRSFKHLSNTTTGSTHLLVLGSNRYDFWRVSLHEFGRHPLAGIGARGFMPAYLKERRSVETPARAHSLPLDVLAETGLVGFVLLVLALGAPLLASVRTAVAGGPRAPPATAAFAGAVYWLAHASVDWLWTIPAVGLPFFVLLGIGASDARAALGARARYAAAGVAVAAAAFLFAPPWIAARLTSRGESKGRLGDLRWARRFDPLTLEPLYAQFRLARSPHERIRIAREAVAKEPRWVGTRYLLGIAYLQAGRKADARRELREALRLSPKEERISKALRRAEAPG